MSLTERNESVIFTCVDKEQPETVHPIMHSSTTMMYYSTKPENPSYPSLHLYHTVQRFFFIQHTQEGTETKQKNHKPSRSVSLNNDRQYKCILYINRKGVGKVFLIMPNGSLAMI